MYGATSKYAYFIITYTTNSKTDFNSTWGMAPNVAPPKKRASSYVSRYAAVRDTIELPHIDLIGST